jgi:hypothetical protein
VDREDNVTQRTVSVFYKTNYLPIDSGAYWVFQGSSAIDNISITVNAEDSMDYLFYSVSFKNAIWPAMDTTVTLIHYDDIFYVGTGYTNAILHPDTLSFFQYSATSKTFSGKTATFVGDTVFSGVQYRNCVRLTFNQTAKELAKIKDIYLVPYQGPVYIRSSDSPQRNYTLDSARYPGSGI